MHPPPVRQFARLAIAFTLTLMIGLLGASHSAWATPVQRPAGQTVPTPTPGGPQRTPVSSGDTASACQIPTTAVTPPGDILPAEAVRTVLTPCVAATIDIGPLTIVIGEDAVAAPGTLQVAPLVPGDAMPPGANFSMFGRQLSIVFYDANGQIVPHPTFARPIQICFAYAQADLDAIGGNPANFAIRFFDELANNWVTLPTTPAPGNKVCASVDHLTLFALTGAAGVTGSAVQPATGPIPASLPRTDESGVVIPSWVWAAIALLLVTGAALVFWTRRRARVS